MTSTCSMMNRSKPQRTGASGKNTPPFKKLLPGQVLWLLIDLPVWLPTEHEYAGALVRQNKNELHKYFGFSVDFWTTLHDESRSATNRTIIPKNVKTNKQNNLTVITLLIWTRYHHVHVLSNLRIRGRSCQWD